MVESRVRVCVQELARQRTRIRRDRLMVVGWMRRGRKTDVGNVEKKRERKGRIGEERERGGRG